MGCNLNNKYIVQADLLYDMLLNNIHKHNLTNVKIFKYVGESYDRYVDNKNVIHLSSGDNYSNTYNKTIECFEFIKHNYNDFDYIIRINTSTYINIVLLNEILKQLNNDDIVFSHELFNVQNNKQSNKPYHDNISLCGKFMMFSKKMIDVILNNKYVFMDNDKYVNAGTSIENNGMITYGVDDMCISNVINIYHLNNNENPSDYVSSFINIPQPFLINNNLLNYAISICCKDHNSPDNNLFNIFHYLNDYYNNYEIDNKFIDANINNAKNPRVFFIDKQGNSTYYKIHNSLL